MEEGRTPGEANEVVVLEGKDVTLRPTMEMAIHFCRGQGGIHGATMRCINLDIDTIVEVVKMGANMPSTDPKLLKRIQKAVYESGLREVGTKCCSLLAALANGGRKAAEPTDEDGDGDGPLGEAASG